MSENITHTAICDDALRLYLAGGEACEAFVAAAEGHWDVARLGSITRQGDRCNPGLLASYRDAWPGDADGRLPAKLAFVMGWLCHRAADREMKPIFRAIDADCPQKPTDCSIAHDVFLFREVYAGGAEKPYSPQTFALSAEPGPDALAALEELIRTLLQRTLIALHTFIPDLDDPDAWLDRVLDTRQVYKVALGRYAEALLNPDPDAVRRFVDEANFYDREDPAIAAARALQRGRHVPPGEVRAAVAAEPRSHYATALVLSVSYLDAAAAFFNRRIDDAELRDRLNIGRPGRDGKGV